MRAAEILRHDAREMSYEELIDALHVMRAEASLAALDVHVMRELNDDEPESFTREEIREEERRRDQLNACVCELEHRRRIAYARMYEAVLPEPKPEPKPRVATPPQASTRIMIKVDERLVDDWNAFHATYTERLSQALPGHTVLLYRNPHRDEETPRIHIRDLERDVTHAEVAADILTNAPEISHVYDYTVLIGYNDVRTPRRIRDQSANRWLDDTLVWASHWSDLLPDDYEPMKFGYAGGTMPDDDDAYGNDAMMGLQFGSRARRPGWKPVKI